jgi:hypothetical protein
LKLFSNGSGCNIEQGFLRGPGIAGTITKFDDQAALNGFCEFPEILRVVDEMPFSLEGKD